MGNRSAASLSEMRRSSSKKIRWARWRCSHYTGAIAAAIALLGTFVLVRSSPILAQEAPSAYRCRSAVYVRLIDSLSEVANGVIRRDDGTLFVYVHLRVEFVGGAPGEDFLGQPVEEYQVLTCTPSAEALPDHGVSDSVCPRVLKHVCQILGS